jgi:hypothetical protein
MSWFTLKSPEGQAKQYIEEQKKYGVTGSFKKRYNFTLNQQQWIAPGYSSRNTIKGVFDCGLEHTDPKTFTQTWSIELRNLVFDWNPQALPEIYFLFAYPSRINVRIDTSGHITDGSTWVNYADKWGKKYKNEVFTRIENPERANNFYNSLCGTNHELAVGLLRNNPLMTALGNVANLDYRLNSEPSDKGEFGERYTGELVKENYFGEDIHLPLKTTWLKKETGDEKTEEWAHLGGLIAEKYPEEAFRRMMRKATGIFNLEVPMHVEFSEFYRLTKPVEGFRQTVCCGLCMQTIVRDVWLKHEDLEMNEDGKGVVYGQG